MVHLPKGKRKVGILRDTIKYIKCVHFLYILILNAMKD